MALRPLKSFLPTADDLLQQDLPTLGGILLTHLKSYDGLNTVSQHAGLNRGYFRAMLENRSVGLGPLPNEPEYGPRQSEVTTRMMEAWNWLERQGLLIHNDQQAADWFTISSDGVALLKQNAREEQWQKLGVDVVKHDLLSGGTRFVGGPPENREAAMQWVRQMENKPPKTPARPGYMTLISESRLAELRALTSPDFDFKKLIRVCEELNIAFQEECYFATAMLTRSLLDHVPPVFGCKTFSEVANNYAGGGRSFKETMLHLENASRKVGDAHLHMPIRKSETQPTAQQVNCGQQLDVLLSEIVRISATSYVAALASETEENPIANASNNALFLQIAAIAFPFHPLFQPPRLNEAMNGGTRHADDLGDGCLGDLLLQENAYLFLFPVEA
jgi:hypothetical protein